MVQIYSEENTDYEHNGDAVLDPISCDLHVVLNGSWEVTLESALDEQEKFQTILTNAVLSADTPVSDKQLFRIYDVERADTGVTAYARPIFLDSAREVFLNDCRPTNLTGQEALNYLMQGTPYSGKTDITLTNTAYYIRKNLIEAIAGSEDNSFLTRWGGEISYDNYTINILVQQGEDNGLRVEFGTNIESIKEIIDVDEMATRVVPVAFNGRTLDGDEPWVDSPLIDNYPIIYTKIVEFSDMRLTEDLSEDEDPDDDDNTYYDTLEELQEAMIARVKQLYVEGLDLPSITYEVNMLDLRRADEYEEYKDLETVNLGDTVHCYHRRLGIETQARVIEYNYDCIRKCITSLVIGDFREDYLDHLSDITSSSGGTVDFSQIWDRFDYIEANYIRTNQLEAEIAKFGYLTAAEADITYARITDLTAALAQINEIIADEIYAVYIDVDALDASVANIISLLGGDIATGTLDTIHLTVENAVIDSEVVVNALIDQAIIGDLLAGVIYTDYITIMDNENGNMILAGPTIQFIDSDGNYRMQVGLDEQGNFNIYIIDADGNTIFDALGLTEAGLIGNGAIIRDVAVADDANISGYKLNIQEIATILNEDGSLIVDAGQVIINGQQLSTVYTEIVADINTALTDAEKALELAGEVIEIGARNYLLNTRALTQDPLKTLYTGFTLSEDESEFGILTEESGNSQIVMLTAISAEKNSLSGKNMVFSCDMLEDELTSILEDYELEFGIYSSNDNGETWTKYASLGSGLDDDSVFDINRDDLRDGEWCRLIAKFTAGIEHTHTIEGTPTFIWGDDMTCDAVYTCSACGQEIREKCDVTETGTDPTCTDDGALTYTATVTIDGNEYSDTKVVTIPALGHDYAFDGFVWASDYSSCVARFVCTRDSAETEQACDVTAQTEPATCTDDGLTVYTATCEFEGTQYTDRKEVVLPALGHSYSEPTFDWNSDFSACTATFTCERCDDAQTVQCSIVSERTEPTDTEAGKVTYTATCEFNGNTYSNIVEDIIPAIGHTYGDPTFEWASDFSTCTAVFSCINGDDTQSIVCAVSAQTVDATCTEDGSVTYTATAVFDDKTYTDVQVEIIPALGHDYSYVFNWSDDYLSCTATFTCSRGDDVQTVQCTVTVDGKEHTATVEFNGQTYTDVYVEASVFAVYSAGDGSFTFYRASGVPSAGDTYNNKIVTNVYTDFENETWTGTGQNPWYSIRTSVISVDFDISFKDVQPVSMAFWFYNMTNLTDILNTSNIDTSNVETLNQTFFGCSSLINIDVSTWNTSKVETMYRLFYGCSGLTSLDVSNWDVSSVTTLYQTFYGCSDLTTLDVSEWNVSSVETLYNTFNGCSSLTSLDVSEWDVSSVTTLQYTFASCSGLTNLDVSNWNVSNVTILYQTFYNCSGLTSLDVSTWNTSKVENMYRLFYGCSSLTSLDVSEWNVSNVTTLYQTFYNCSNLTSLDVSEWNVSKVETLYNTFCNCSKLTDLDVSNWDVSNVTSLYQTFCNCSGLTSLDISKWNTAKVTDMYRTFSGCSNLITIYSDDNVFVTTAVTSGADMFRNCSKLVGGNGTAYDSSNYTYTMAHIDTAANPGYFTDIAVTMRQEFAIYSADDSSLTFYMASDIPSAGDTYNNKVVTNVYTDFANSTWTETSQIPWYSIRTSIVSVEFDASFKEAKPVSMAYWFYGMTKLTNIVNVSNIDTSNVKTLYYTFYNCSKLTTLDVSTWDVSSVTILYGTFRGCSSLTTLDVSTWDVSSVTDMQYTFYTCSELTTLDVSTWDVSSVTTLYCTFRGCSSLTTLDVSKWDVSSVTTLYYTFTSCSSLTTLDVSTWDVSSVTTLYDTFEDCSGLTSLDVSKWDVSSVTSLYFTFYGCSGLTTIDVSKWDTSKVTNMSYMFRDCSNLTTIYSDDNIFVTSGLSSSSSGNYMFQNCSKLVGGNGTAYDSSNYTYKMAHIDTASNPGYFTDVADKP